MIPYFVAYSWYSCFVSRPLPAVGVPAFQSKAMGKKSRQQKPGDSFEALHAQLLQNATAAAANGVRGAGIVSKLMSESGDLTARGKEHGAQLMRQRCGLPANASKSEIFDATFKQMSLEDTIRWLRKGINVCGRTVSNCLERLVEQAPSQPELSTMLQIAPDLAAVLRLHSDHATTVDTVFLLITEVDHATHTDRAVQWRNALAAAGIMPLLVAALTSPCADEFEVRRLGANALAWLLAPVDFAPDDLPPHQRKEIGKMHRELKLEALEAGVLPALVLTIQASGQPPTSKKNHTSKRGSCAETFGLACAALERMLCGEASVKSKPEVRCELQERLEKLKAMPAVMQGMETHDGDKAWHAEAQASAMAAITALICGNEPLEARAKAAGAKQLIATAKRRHEAASETVQHALALGSMRVPSIFGPPSTHKERDEAMAAYNSLGQMCSADADDQRAPAVVVQHLMRSMQLDNKKNNKNCSAALPDALCGMATFGDVGALATYLSSGGDVDAMHSRAGTLLHIACSKESRLMAPWAAPQREGFVEALLAARANVQHDHPQTGGTALHAASDSGALGIARRLLAKGAHAGKADGRGYTPLIEASREGHEDIVEVLIGANAHLDAQQRTGMTALMAAVYGDSIGVVQRLLAAGARTDITDQDGVTAARMAGHMGRLQMVRAIVARRCAHCHAVEGSTKLMACSRCNAVRYCRRECQKAAWKAHKLECVPCKPLQLKPSDAGNACAELV